jgi:hypothetical protein
MLGNVSSEVLAGEVEGGDILPPSRAASWMAYLVLVSIVQNFE